MIYDAVFFGWLETKRPDLLPKYEHLYSSRAYMRPEQRKRTTRAVRGWGRSRLRSSEASRRAVSGAGDSGGGVEHVDLARRPLPRGQDPPPQQPLF